MPTPEGSGAGSFAARWAAFSNQNRALLLIACTLLCAAGATGTVKLYSDLRPDITELLPKNARSARDVDIVSTRVRGWGEDAVTLSGADRETMKRFGDDLAAAAGWCPTWKR